MNKLFLESLDKRELALYTFDINVKLYNLSIDENINSNIRKFSNEALINSWSLEKKITFLNSLEGILY